MLQNTLEKLAKWRSVFASWQLGTRLGTDAECNAVKDHREVTILLRTEVNALTSLLIEKGIFTVEEFQSTIAKEAEFLDKAYEEKFPGFKTTLFGVDIDIARARRTMREMNWRE